MPAHTFDTNTWTSGLGRGRGGGGGKQSGPDTRLGVNGIFDRQVGLDRQSRDEVNSLVERRSVDLGTAARCPSSLVLRGRRDFLAQVGIFSDRLSVTACRGLRLGRVLMLSAAASQYTATILPVFVTRRLRAGEREQERIRGNKDQANKQPGELSRTACEATHGFTPSCSQQPGILLRRQASSCSGP